VNAVLVRVGIDCTDDGHWNGPVDIGSGNFVYVPIAETKPLRDGFERLYDELRPALAAHHQSLPPNLVGRRMHLDPDFSSLTYGDQGRRAAQIQKMAVGDLLVFYASLRAVEAGNLVYAVIGLMVIDKIIWAMDVPPDTAGIEHLPRTRLRLRRYTHAERRVSHYDSATISEFPPIGCLFAADQSFRASRLAHHFSISLAHARAPAHE
jgi:hypothetical protein